MYFKIMSSVYSNNHIIRLQENANFLGDVIFKYGRLKKKFLTIPDMQQSAEEIYP